MNRTSLLALTFVLGASVAHSQALTHVWSRAFVGNGDVYGNAVAVDALGNVILAGHFNGGSLDMGGGPIGVPGGTEDIFLAKYDANGVHQWSKRFGDTSFDEGLSVTVDAQGNILLAGLFHGTVDFGGGPRVALSVQDIFLAKYNFAGLHQWSKNFGDSGGTTSLNAANGVAVDASGNVFVSGTFHGTVDFGGGPLGGPGSQGIFLAKYDPDGVHKWSRSFGAAGTGWNVAVDIVGNVVVTGGFTGTVDFGGGPITSASAGHAYDFFVAKYNATGTYQWIRHCGPLFNVDQSAVTVDNGGNVIVTGTLRGTLDFGGGPLVSAGYGDVFLAKYDADGAHQWSQRFGGAGEDQGLAVAVDAISNVFLTGYFTGSVDFGGGNLTGGCLLAKYSSTGGHVWSRSFGSAFGLAIAVDSSDDLLLTGDFIDVVDFGGGELLGLGGSDAFLAKFANDGRCPQDRTIGAGAQQRFTITLYNSTSATNWEFYKVYGDASLKFEMEAAPNGFTSSLVGALSMQPHTSVDLFAWVQVAANAVSGNTLYFHLVHQLGAASPDTCAVTVHVGSSTTGVGGATPAIRRALLGSVPNPFSSSTRLQYVVPANAGEVTLSVYDASGRRVRTLVRRVLTPGEHAAEWNGMDDQNAKVPSGMYFGVLRGNGFQIAAKLLLLR